MILRTTLIVLAGILGLVVIVTAGGIVIGRFLDWNHNRKLNRQIRTRIAALKSPSKELRS